MNFSTDLIRVYDEFKDEMSEASEFQERESGWALENVMVLDVHINKFSLLSGS